MNHVERSLDLQVFRPIKPVTNEQVGEIGSWAKAMAAAVATSGLKDKSLAIEIDVDPAHFSKMVSGQLGVMPDKLFRFMDACGSELPLMWLLYQRGYDLSQMKQRQTNLEREIEALKAQLRAERTKNAIITEFCKEVRP